MPVTLAPAACRARATGSAMAQPTPPPTTQTFFRPSISVALPSGPTKSCRLSPSFRVFSCMVPAPTIWKMMSTVPAAGSVPAMVSGMRSESSLARRMINWPALAFLAISGASMDISVTVGFRLRFFAILNTVVLLCIVRFFGRGTAGAGAACFSALRRESIYTSILRHF